MNHIISPEIETPGSLDDFAPIWDYTGQTQYAFEVNWTTATSAEISICTSRDEDQNKDCTVDIIDFGRFAGDFGKSGSIGTASDGSELVLEADTLCVHGDNPESVAAVKAIRQALMDIEAAS